MCHMLYSDGNEIIDVDEDCDLEMDSSLNWGAEARPTERVADYGESVSAGGTVSRLRRGIFRGRAKRNDRVDQDEGAGKLGMIEGVFFRVLTNLFGVILFLRLGWLTAYSGIGLAILVVIVSSSLTLITSLSLSAICTNGKVAAGGAYYLISRALGPEFGGSIGVLFYIATTVSVALYLLGFAETVVSQTNGPIINEEWDERFIAFLGLIFCQLVCFVGVSVVVKVEKFMLLILLISLLLFVIGVLIGPSENDERIKYGFVSLQGGLNVGSDFLAITEPMPKDLSYLGTGIQDSTQCATTSQAVLQKEYGNLNLGIALAVFFPAVTGILAGANISGDLKNPSYAIPAGTVSAIILGALIYIMLVVLFGASFYRVTILSAVPTGKNTTVGLPEYNCEYSGLFHDSLAMVRAAVLPKFLTFGIFAASISSALASLLGAPRILQALAKDRLFATFDPLAKGYGASDEPLRAYAVTSLIALLCILTGDINTVAPIITTFFLSSYAMVNYACFSAEESKSPGWRPTFKYFDRWLAFVGAMGCISLMLFLSAITGFVTFTIGLALYKYVEVSNREGLGSASNWGPHKEAAEYNTALRAALLLEKSVTRVVPTAAKKTTPKANKKAKEQQLNRATSNVSHTEIELGASSDIINQRYPEQDEEDHQRQQGLEEGVEMDEEELGDSFAGHEPLFDSTHVKNYRPQCLVLAGPPQRRPALAVFVAGLRKARGVTVFGDILVGDLSDPDLLRIRNRRASVSYVAKYGVKAFNDVIIAPSFRTGCRSLLQLAGLGRRMRINTVVMGFLDDWHIPQSQRVQRRHVQVDPSSPNREGDDLRSIQVEEQDYAPPPSIVDYVGVIGDAFDLGLGVAILRGELDLLRSEYLTQTIRTEMERVLTLGFGTATDHFASRKGAYANPNYAGDLNRPRQLQSVMSHESVDFENGDTDNAPHPSSQRSIDIPPPPGAAGGDGGERKSARRIDVWWLVDDGGLTIMLPHILRQAKSPPWTGCSLRVMAIGGNEEECRKEKDDMTKLLSKLRIPAQVSMVSLSEIDAEDGQAKSPVSRHMEDDDEMENIALDEVEPTVAHPPPMPSVGSSTMDNLQRQLFRAYSSMDESQNKSRRETYKKVGKLIKRFSGDALLVAVSLPVPPMSLDPEEYMHWLDLLSNRKGGPNDDPMPPVLMVRGSQRDVVTMFT